MQYRAPLAPMATAAFRRIPVAPIVTEFVKRVENPAGAPPGKLVHGAGAKLASVSAEGGRSVESSWTTNRHTAIRGCAIRAASKPVKDVECLRRTSVAF